MTLKVIPLLQAFSSAIRRTFVQYFTRFQLTAHRAVLQRQLGFLYMLVCFSFLLFYGLRSEINSDDDDDDDDIAWSSVVSVITVRRGQ